MSDDTRLFTAQAPPDWRLVTEFVMTKPPASKRMLVTEMSDAIQAHNVPTACQQQLNDAMVQTLNRLEQRQVWAKGLPAVHIRVWSSMPEAGSDSWGFFMVEKTGSESRHEAVELTYFVDVFLYQERSLGAASCS